MQGVILYPLASCNLVFALHITIAFSVRKRSCPQIKNNSNRKKGKCEFGGGGEFKHFCLSWVSKFQTQRKMANHSVQVIYLHNKTDHKLSVLYYQQESIWMRLVAVAVLSKCVLPSGQLYRKLTSSVVLKWTILRIISIHSTVFKYFTMCNILYNMFAGLAHCFLLFFYTFYNLKNRYFFFLLLFLIDVLSIFSVFTWFDLLDK